MEAYIAEVKKLAQTLLNKMAKALGIDEIEMAKLFEPNKVIGLTSHSDADALTILFQLNDIQGLQIRKDGNWIPVTPLKNALVVNIGDIIEQWNISSIEHRSTVNSTKERLSVATFYFPSSDSELRPANSIIGPLNPPIFRTESMEQYLKKFFARELYGKSCLEDMKL
ncbi:putative 2-oxoglutarate/Fe(II)-dependent dioxygenase [Bienertia sinuspersici]